MMPHSPISSPARTAVAVICLVLTGCASIPDVSSWLTPYRIDVRQGNFVTREMTRQLRIGQTKDQVRYILGTPLVTDLFHADRWDYIYRFRPGRDGAVQERRLTVYFSNGALARVTGDVIADESIAEQDRALNLAKGVIEIGADTPTSTEPAHRSSDGPSIKVDPSMSWPTNQ